MHPFQQPYKQGMGTRAPGHALSAMLAGRTLYGQNPMDQQRQAQDPNATARAGLAQLLMMRAQQQPR